MKMAGFVSLLSIHAFSLLFSITDYTKLFFQNKANPKSRSDTAAKVYDNPNPFSDFELSGK